MSMLTRLIAESSGSNITYVGGTTATTTNALSGWTASLTSLTGGAASAPATGDLILVFYSATSSVQNLGATGFTAVASLFSSDSSSTNLFVGYKVVGGTPDTSVTLSATSASIGGAVAIQVWRGVDTKLPLDLVAQTVVAANTILANPPSITPNTPGAVIVAGGAGAYGLTTAQTYSATGLSAFRTASPTTGRTIVGVGYSAWNSGAFDPAQFTFNTTNSGSYSCAAVTLALRPAYTGPVPTYIASSTTQNANNTDLLSIAMPTGTQTGDLMVAVMAAQKDGSKSSVWSGDTGWTEVADQGAIPALRIAYKVATSSESSPYTFTYSDNQQLLSGSILTYRNATYSSIGNLVSTNSSSITPTGPSALSSFSLLVGASAVVGTEAITSPTGMTSRVNDSVTAPNHAVADQLVPAGATGSKTFTMNNNFQISGVLLLLAPA